MIEHNSVPLYTLTSPLLAKLTQPDRAMKQIRSLQSFGDSKVVDSSRVTEPDSWLQEHLHLVEIRFVSTFMSEL